jgi:hypothetical protein
VGPPPPDAGAEGCGGDTDCPISFACVEVFGAPGGQACEPTCPAAQLPAQVPPGSLQVTGSLPGFGAIPTADVVVSTSLTEDGSPDAPWVRTLTLTPTPWTSACEHQALDVTVLRPGEPALVLTLTERSATRPASALFPPGTYAFGGPVELRVGGSETASGGTGSGLPVPLRPGESTTLVQATNLVRGTFELVGLEGRLNGDFQARICNPVVQRRAACCVGTP